MTVVQDPPGRALESLPGVFYAVVGTGICRKIKPQRKIKTTGEAGGMHHAFKAIMLAARHGP